MLCQFSFQNFKSFKNEAFLDFCAEPISDHVESLIVDKDGEKFLPVLSIYGPNGGGKSNVLEALRYLRHTIVTPGIAFGINESMTEENKKILSGSMEDMRWEKYHKFCEDGERKPIHFEIRFRTEGNEYLYELSILKNEIVRENLYLQAIGTEEVMIVFERSNEGYFLGEELESVPIGKVRSSLSLLAYLAFFYDVKVVEDVVSWFLSINFLDYDEPTTDKRVLIPRKEERRKAIFSMLRAMDINIFDVRIEEDAEGNIKDIFCKHMINGEEYELKIQEESSGTRKIFSCLAQINDCLKDGGVLIADELDAKLHPKLLRFIIELFTDASINEKGAQLLMTSHDTVNMNPEVFRRDEIWFSALNASNASSLYSLVAFKGENVAKSKTGVFYGKRYLEGRYGADPYIKKELDWGLSDELKTKKSK